MLPLVPVLALLVMQPTGPCRSSLEASHSQVKPGQTFQAVVTLTTEEGWHVYWSNPGDSGMASRVAWTLPPGVTASPARFPVPHPLVEESGITFVFDGRLEMVFDLVVSPSFSAQTLRLQARSDWLVCKTSCLPGSGIDSLTLKVGPEATPSAGAERVRAAAARIPKDAEPDAVSLKKTKSGVEIRWTTPTPRPDLVPVFLPSEEAAIDYKSQKWDAQHGLPLVGSLPFGPDAVEKPSRLKGLLGWATPDTFELKPELTVNIDLPLP